MENNILLVSKIMMYGGTKKSCQQTLTGQIHSEEWKNCNFINPDIM